MRRNPRSLTTALIVVVTYLLATLTTACAPTTLSGGQGATTVVIPSFTPLPMQTPPLTTPGAVAGTAAIKPHLSAIPAFTTQDMADYAKGHLPSSGGTSGSPLVIVHNEFLPSQEVSRLLGGASTFHPDGSILGFIEAQGTFTLAFGVPGGGQSYPYAFEVFDGRTGNLVMFGGLTQPTPNQPPTPQVTATSTPTAAPNPPRLSVTAQLNAFCLNGQYPPITVRNSGGGTLTWSAKPAYSGITLTPSSGSLVGGASQVVTATGSAPPPTESIAFASNGGNAPITFTCS